MQLAQSCRLLSHADRPLKQNLTNVMHCTAQELFKEKHYADLDGGILEGFGRLLKYDLKLYVYPTLDEQTGELVTAETLQVSADLLIVCNACHTLHSVS